jgi:hypothetical protein
MMGLAREEKEKKTFGKLEAFFKIYNTNQGTVFYFNNPSENQTVTAEFNLTTMNLELQDSTEKDRFRIVLAPQQESYKVLLPIDRNKNTSLKMGYSVSADL